MIVSGTMLLSVDKDGSERDGDSVKLSAGGGGKRHGQW